MVDAAKTAGNAAWGTAQEVALGTMGLQPLIPTQTQQVQASPPVAPAVAPGKGVGGPEKPPEAKPAPAAQPQQAPAPRPISGGSVEGEMRRGYSDLQKASEQVARIEEQRLAEEAQIRQTLGAARDKRFAEIDAGINTTMARIGQEDEAIRNSQIDPSRLWHTSGAGAQIASVIGIMLGGLSQGMIGGENQALKVINGAIDRDIRAQEMELGKKQSRLHSNMQLMRDLNASKELTAAEYKNRIASALETSAAKYGGLAKNPAAAELAAKLKIDAAQHVDAAKTHAVDRTNRELDTAYKQLQLRAALSGGAEQYDKFTIPNALGPGQHIRALPGDEKGADKLREMNNNRLVALEQLDKMIELRKKHHSEKLWTEAKGEMESLMADFTPAYLKSNGLGTLDKGTEGLVNRLMAGGPAAYGHVLHVLEQLRGRTQSKFNHAIRSYADPRSLGGGQITGVDMRAVRAP